VTAHETRVALVDNGVLQEVQIERAAEHGLVGNIYKGRVIRVLPGMQAAFVDIGLERSAFLHASDIGGEPRQAQANEGRGCGTADRVIEQLVHEGQEVLVQVVKEPLGGKGARLSMRLSVPSRYLVMMPSADGIGVSTRIEDEAERARLRETMAAEIPAERDFGYIVRTAGEGADSEALRNDIEVLDRIWETIESNAATARPGTLVHGDLPLVLRILRDLMGPEVERIRIDAREAYEAVVRFGRSVVPDSVARVEHYQGERPIFDLFGVEDEIQRALQREVPLKSGGHLAIDQTESMTTVDVNTGGYVGRRNLEETIFKTNLEAAQALARQLRVRNLGGIIIIDFIDMDDPEHRRQVLRALHQAMEKDRARARIGEVSALGLVEMTRKRTRDSLQRVLCDPCPVCGGRGFAKSAETVCFEILREIVRAARQFDASALLVLAAQPVIDRLVDEQADELAELESSIARPVRLQAEGLYQVEQYDVVLM